MRETLLAVAIVLAGVTSAAAETSRFEIGPVVRLDRIFIEGGAAGNTAAAGVAATWRFSKTFAIEAEMTHASRRVERSYEGRFVSYATSRDAPREEIERLSPIARRSLAYVPGFGGTAAFRAGGEINRRVTIGARVGVAARRYTHSSAYTILSIPDGVDPARVARDHADSSARRLRGGLLFGFDTSIMVTPHVSVVPEVRFVYGGPARIGDKYRECGVGLRAAWRF
jgi:hypothetical protein